MRLTQDVHPVGHGHHVLKPILSHVLIVCLLALMSFTGLAAAQDPPRASVFAVPGFDATVRTLYVWDGGHRLLIGTIESGLHAWRAGQNAPDPTAFDIGRVLAIHPLRGDVVIGTETGLFRWRIGEGGPERVPGVTGGAYEFQDWNDDRSRGCEIVCVRDRRHAAQRARSA